MHDQVFRGDRVHGSPRISVVIPAYSPAWLDDALDSVRAQTVRDWELIVVDDGSPDPVRPRRTDDVVLIRQPNEGPGGARNRGAALARGELVAYLDTDDRWTPDKLERPVALHDAHDDLVMSCTDLVARRSVRERVRFTGDRIPYESLFYENPIACSSVMVRRDALVRTPGMMPHRRLGEDYGLWLRLGLLGPIGYVEQPLLDRRVHDDGLMAQAARDGSWIEHERAIYDELLREAPDLIDRPFVRAARARLEFQVGWSHLGKREWSAARRALVQSIWYEPRRIKAWFDLARAVLHVGPRSAA
jgi:glycosyltransferase involved in cell wall biosynthesis